jgi:hypothetical protein
MTKKKHDEPKKVIRELTLNSLLLDIISAWQASDATALEDALHRARDFYLGVQKKS